MAKFFKNLNTYQTNGNRFESQKLIVTYNVKIQNPMKGV